MSKMILYLLWALARCASSKHFHDKENIGEKIGISAEEESFFILWDAYPFTSSRVSYDVDINQPYD